GPQDAPKPDSPKKFTNGLVAASCAAVLAVYAAGYTRTQSAADRLASQIAKRRVTVSTPQQARLSIKDSAAFRDPGREEHGDHRRPVEAAAGPRIPPPQPPEIVARAIIADSSAASTVKVEAPAAPAAAPE